LKTTDFDYDLPETYIAQVPTEPRDHSRLLIYHRRTQSIIHTHFFDLPGFLSPGDVLVANRTRVIQARLIGRKLPGNGKVEILLLKQTDSECWEALVGGKRMEPGRIIQLDQGLQAEIVENLGGSNRLVCIRGGGIEVLEKIGQVPLPPYIHQRLENPDRYQTIYAKDLGSAAAPTAGLHFTQHLMDELTAQGVKITWVTLHVGLDTFSPVHEENPSHHIIHSEWRSVPADTVELVRNARKNGNRVIAIGTTSVRTLESAASTQVTGTIDPVEGQTSLYILPGYQFKTIDGMVTNFHLPRSTLIMMVSAFVGRSKVLSIYQNAMQLGYRFYSFGDAMLLL
jgi:S-adenosylmethionine:tRNA ribosyltransferase-isomerase